MTDATDPPKKNLSLADLFDQADRAAPDRPATTIADAARGADQKIDWQEKIRAAKRTIEDPPTVIAPTDSMHHLVEEMRAARRRIRATEDAEQRTVAALEALRKEAQAGRTGNRWMLFLAAVAALTGIISAWGVIFPPSPSPSPSPSIAAAPPVAPPLIQQQPTAQAAPVSAPSSRP
ncbi:hypothetical protein [Variovorax sp. J31P207]|uniref:hypothetical protein n=1 Tax=Variovorax sp. J31P207 TaxID=3053510 RepID=UPI002577C527|nr:hypothetical protein [Variovorax sp. J31P207]MDM0068365.1 hypothetical protein [Variovorax sp. J31P207]